MHHAAEADGAESLEWGVVFFRNMVLELLVAVL
jgi:hypothetical protein